MSSKETEERLAKFILAQESDARLASGTAWSLVGAILGYGSTSATEWCVRNNIDPEMKVRRALI